VYFDECDYSIYIPSAFTPDNDGLNDVFFVYATNLQRAELSVFNRWGVLVFSTTDISQPWTGDVESGSYFVPDGVYAYQLKFITDKGEAGETSGHITVIR
jgi:gliding motility-associated-like protein